MRKLIPTKNLLQAKCVPHDIPKHPPVVAYIGRYEDAMSNKTTLAIIDKDDESIKDNSNQMVLKSAASAIEIAGDTIAVMEWIFCHADEIIALHQTSDMRSIVNIPNMTPKRLDRALMEAKALGVITVTKSGRLDVPRSVYTRVENSRREIVNATQDPADLKALVTFICKQSGLDRFAAASMISMARKYVMKEFSI